MSRNYHSIAFTAPVMDSQVRYGSRAAMSRTDRIDGMDPEVLDSMSDPLGGAEREFISEQDGFYLATTSVSGWPYVQFRGGPPGFVTSPDEHTLAWADLRGNRQYISTGNLVDEPRVAMIFLDYARQLRLKVFGVASVNDVHGPGPYRGELVVPAYRTIVEREVRVEVRAFDWNCPLHITPRYTVDELAPVLGPLRSRVGELEAENQLLKERLESLPSTPEPPASGSIRRKDQT